MFTGRLRFSVGNRGKLVTRPWNQSLRQLEQLEDRRLLAFEPGFATFAEPLGPTPFVPRPIEDVFSRHAVTVEDMVAQASTFTYQPNELVVAYHATASSQWTDRLGNPNVTVIEDLLTAQDPYGSDVHLVHLNLGTGSDVIQSMYALRDDQDVLWSAPNFTMLNDPRELTPDDPQYNQQYHHPLMQNNLAWDVTLGDAGIIVAITDDGFELAHPDLQSNIWVNSGEVPGNGIDDDGNGYVDDVNGWDFISNNNNPNPNSSANSHGTHVAGIAAARTNNAIGVAGTAGHSTIMPLQFYDLSMGWNATVVSNAFRYAADNGAKIVTTSYNMDGWVGNPVVTAGMQYAYDAGLLLFNSAGNNNAANPPRQAFEQTLLVVSTDQNDIRSSFSNYGTGVDISAPGSNIRSTLLNGTYGLNSGTSMASPNAAGVAALIWAANPTWNRYQVAAQLLSTADNIDAINPAFAGLLGAGRANAGRAVTQVAPPPRVKTLDGIPTGSAGLGAVINNFRVGYNTVMHGPAVTNPANYDLRSAGNDGVFDTADDQVYTLTFPNAYKVSTNLLQVNIVGGLQGVGDYRLRILSGGVVDALQNPLDGNSDGVAGDPFERFFAIDINDFVRSDPAGSLASVSSANAASLANAADSDLYSIFVQAGEQLAVVATPQSPSVTLSAQILGHTGVITSPAAGAPLLIPATTIGSTGDVQLQITGSGATNYSFDVFRNANIDGLVDNGTPVNIDGSFLSLGSGRNAAIGHSHGSTGGMVFNHYSNPSLFVDISGTGTPLNLGDDGEATIVSTVGNALFPSGNVTVANNGVIVAGAGVDVTWTNTTLPNAALGNSLLPFWDDIDSDTGNVYWRLQQVNGIDALIVQWHNRPHFSNVGNATFQVQVFASGPVLARYVYPDVDFGSPTFDFGASATIGAQLNATTAYQYSFNTPILANGDVIDLSFGTPNVDVDEYQLDLTDAVGRSVDVIVDSLGTQSLSGQTVELLNSSNVVVASSTTGATNYDLGIRDYLVTSGGLYTVRVSLNVTTRYSVLVTQGLAFDTESNNSLASTARSLNNVDGALGFLTGAGERDVYQIDMAAGETITFSTATPLDHAEHNPQNSLDPSLSIYSAGGALLATDSNSLDGKNARVEFTAGGGTYYVAINREAGAGEYVLRVGGESVINGDFNNDGLYDCVDIDMLVNAIANGGTVALFDLNGDGILSLLDVDDWRAEAGGINLGPGRVYGVGDANLDGAVDGSDFNIWNSNKFTPLAAWCGGDFNADGLVDGSDFNLWNSNKFTSADADGTSRDTHSVIQFASLQQTESDRSARDRRAEAIDNLFAEEGNA